MPVLAMPVSSVSRQHAARMLRVSERQLVAWQRAGLIVDADSFTLRELAGIRKLCQLRQQRLSVRSIRTSVEAMQRLVGTSRPLEDSGPVTRGSRLVFRHQGALLDPLRQQFVLDFNTAGGQSFPWQTPEVPRGQQAREQARAHALFQHAVRLEDQPGQAEAAAELYRETLRTWPHHAAAHINLGTILYNARRFHEAEEHYRAAVETDPDYALAFFDLGNVLDELRRLPEAIAAYSRAVQLVPQYADAHYNLALAYERTGERRRALRHWVQYVRLDPVGPWATHARMQARRTLATERLSIVTRGGKRA